MKENDKAAREREKEKRGEEQKIVESRAKSSKKQEKIKLMIVPTK